MANKSSTVVISFSISAGIEYDDKAIEQERLRLGRFSPLQNIAPK